MMRFEDLEVWKRSARLSAELFVGMQPVVKDLDLFSVTLK
jgi:hypothetical protein